ncbi:MAG: polysaccharide pyruvyl transferase family protein [Thomasclavelia sp.]
MKVIGMYGIAGVYNLGCEAIVRGTYALDKYINDQEIKWIYFSPNAKEDKVKLLDLPVEVVQTKRKNVFIKKVLNKLFDIFKVDRQIPYDDYRDILNQCDTVISIGGDIYTIPEYHRCKNKYPYHNRMVEFGELALKMNKNLIIYGASIGPFGNYERAKNYYKGHLSKVNAIFARENGTINYLNELGVNKNVYFLPDPAFALKGKAGKCESLNRNIIGINLSGLSIFETYGEVTANTVKKLSRIVARIIDVTNCDLLFLPHVFSKYEVDNDYYIMDQIRNSIDSKYKNRIAISEFKDFLSVKKDLLRCKMVIAARMHCAINAMSEGIPTILLSYSSKAIGMCEFVYGNSEWVYNIKNIGDEDFMNHIMKMEKENERIRVDIIKNLNRKLEYKENIDGYKMFEKVIINSRGKI